MFDASSTKPGEHFCGEANRARPRLRSAPMASPSSAMPGPGCYRTCPTRWASPGVSPTPWRPQEAPTRTRPWPGAGGSRGHDRRRGRGDLRSRRAAEPSGAVRRGGIHADGLESARCRRRQRPCPHRHRPGPGPGRGVGCGRRPWVLRLGLRRRVGGTAPTAGTWPRSPASGPSWTITGPPSPWEWCARAIH